MSIRSLGDEATLRHSTTRSERMTTPLHTTDTSAGRDRSSQRRLHHLSLAACPVTARLDGHACWQGSGFLYLRQQQNERVLFLITIRHLLAPRSNSGTHSMKPDTAIFQLRTSGDDPTAVRPVRVPLYTRDGVPTWLESRKWIDSEIVAIPVPGSLCEGMSIHCIDRTWSSPAVATLSAGAPLHVTGFPYSTEARPGAFPLWHAGSLASDPGTSLEDQPMLWASVPPFPGMAGAPAVIAPNRDSGADGEVRRLVGVYAGARSLTGRTAEEVGVHDGIDCVLREFPPWGAIWRAEIIDELIENADLERWQQDILTRLP